MSLPRYSHQSPYQTLAEKALPPCTPPQPKQKPLKPPPLKRG
ncbi:Uncharacterised protein [Vibrio cholerae]|nr:Uncharacterised protein [Vibrio cholerae]